MRIFSFLALLLFLALATVANGEDPIITAHLGPIWCSIKYPIELKCTHYSTIYQDFDFKFIHHDGTVQNCEDECVSSDRSVVDQDEFYFTLSGYNLMSGRRVSANFTVYLADIASNWGLDLALNVTYHPESNSLSWIEPPSLTNSRIAPRLVYWLKISQLDYPWELREAVSGNRFQLPTLTLGRSYSVCMTTMIKTTGVEGFNCPINDATVHMEFQSKNGTTTEWGANTFEILNRGNPRRVRIYFPRGEGFETFLSGQNSRTGQPFMAPQRFAPEQIVTNFTAELDDPTEAYDFTVQYRKGSEHFEQIIHVPADRDILPPVKNLTIVYAMANWQSTIKAATNYTFVWCPTLHSSEAPPNDTRYLYQPPCNGNDFHYALTDSLFSRADFGKGLRNGYDFAYGVVQNSATGTSGIAWVKCLYRQAGGQMVLQNIRGESVNTTAVRVHWAPPVSECNVFDMRYAYALYCPADKCDIIHRFEIAKLESFQSQSSRTEIVLEGLQPGTMYKIVLYFLDFEGSPYEVYASTDELGAMHQK